MTLLSLSLKQLKRNPVRTALTGAGVAVAMFLFSVVETLREGVERATRVTAADTVLVVYRENRYCPFTSRLPQHYQPRIESIPGVVRAIPMKIEVSNCRASLDVVTFRGVPEEAFIEQSRSDFSLVAGSLADWQRRTDAALVGESLAKRRGLRVGDRFSAANITVWIAGILRSEEPQDRNVAYTHLSFIQEASQRGGTGGVVTQFNVHVDSPQRLESVARAIDEEFSRESAPTATRPEKAFVAHAARDILEIVRFASWLGWGSLAAVFALVANTIVLSVQDRITEHAIFQTLGYSTRHIVSLILLEGAVLGLAGGGIGVLAALLFTQRRFSLTMEGLNLEVVPDSTLIFTGFVLSVLLSLLAGIVPALRASRREIAESFRAV